MGMQKVARTSKRRTEHDWPVSPKLQEYCHRCPKCGNMYHGSHKNGGCCFRCWIPEEEK